MNKWCQIERMDHPNSWVLPDQVLCIYPIDQTLPPYWGPHSCCEVLRFYDPQTAESVANRLLPNQVNGCHYMIVEHVATDLPQVRFEQYPAQNEAGFSGTDRIPIQGSEE